MLRHLLYPLLPYRSFAVPILVLCSIVVPCWLAVRVYRRRRAARRPSLARELLLLALVLYLCGLAAATLTPNRSSRYRADNTVGLDLRPNLTSLTCATASVPRGSTARGFCQRNARGNLALFFPLGVLLPLVSTRLRFWSGLGIVVALSVGIEVVQYLSRTWGVNRAADVNDVILNVAGACVGLALMSLLRLRRRPAPVARRA